MHDGDEFSVEGPLAQPRNLARAATSRDRSRFAWINGSTRSPACTACAVLPAAAGSSARIWDAA